MVSYYNPMAMYRQQGPVGPTSGQFHNSGSPTAGWYGGYHHGTQVPTPQQYFNTMQDGETQQVSWHHPHHSVFNHEFFDYNNYLQQQQQQQQHHQQQQQQQQQLQIQRSDPEPQLPSPPMSSSELSSPGAPGGTVTPPNHIRPGPVRSPYDWINKPSYQSQPNPGKTRTKDKYRVVYTDHQRLELEKEFHFSRYITIRRKAELAANLGLSERQVKIWFQNRRAKERKQVKKREELNSKDILNPASVAAAAMQLHQQGLLHHHHHQQQQQQAAVAASVAAAHQTQLSGGHTTVVPVPVPLM